MGYLFGILNGLVTSLEHRNLRLSGSTNTTLINTIRFGVATIVLATLVTIFSTWALPSILQAILILFSLSIESVLMFTYVRAFQFSPQSLVGPIFGFSIVFLVPLGVLFLHESPSLLGGLGIMLVFAGVLLVGWRPEHRHGMDVIRALLHERGVPYMLVAALCASVVVTIAKLTYSLAMPPLNFGFWIMGGLFVTHAPFALRHIKREHPSVPRSTLYAALLFGFGQVFHYVGLSLIYAAYYISLKRSSMVFDTIVAHHIGEDKNFRQRTTGAVIMLFGVVLISISQLV